ncbi:hypothetical protein AC249_AIPGENE18429 [Exaiptasia diaphana]|nr:hypothetical protein AC249_AIPGENE18429 [Exaiptasia diaphana]
MPDLPDNSFSNEKCDCPKKCKQIQYKTTGINVMSLMSESFWSDYTEMILKKYSTVPQHLTEAEFKKKQLIFIVQYDDLYTHKTTERERLDSERSNNKEGSKDEGGEREERFARGGLRRRKLLGDEK